MAGATERSWRQGRLTKLTAMPEPRPEWSRIKSGLLARRGKREKEREG